MGAESGVRQPAFCFWCVNYLQEINMSKKMKTTNNKKHSSLTSGEISVLIDDMEQHSGPNSKAFQIPRFKKKLSQMTEKSRPVGHKKISTEVHPKKLVL
jgi:hypothetical protein